MLELQNGDSIEWIVKPNGTKFDIKIKFEKQ